MNCVIATQCKCVGEMAGALYDFLRNFDNQISTPFGREKITNLVHRIRVARDLTGATGYGSMELSLGDS